MTKSQFADYIENCEFSELFLEQGWDNFSFNRNFEVKENIYTLTGIAEKRGFCIIQCISEKIPDVSIRKQLEKKLNVLYFEHLLIFVNKEKTESFWQLPLYEDKKLKKLVTFSWYKGQDVEGLFQKLRNIVFELKEEEYITLHDVIERVNIFSINSEQVVKKFYVEFAREHKTFLEFIKGIDDSLPDDENEKKQWYASLMLNRLMFCYFIQKKGFLDWNVHYLREKLDECKKLTGKNNFYGFYRSFLLELFHDELGRPEEKRKKSQSPVKFGKIPYLNGGLFDVHELESIYQKITIKDEAFEKIFTFFDKWNWHLDTRVTASGKDINPDVIGYIFEKYINQKEMGAYYTKEDITDYIGKNTIIPFLLEKVKSYYPEPFKPGYGFWQFLQDSDDEYIYDSVEKGAEGCSTIDDVNIPENIKKGIDTTKPNLLERRKDWNTQTSGEIGLPTEIWRETITRIQRYFDLKSKIINGQILEISDFITYNLNIRKLIQDYLEQTQDSKFIREFYKSLCSITILDPTCGSGAFLFAALNILQPLYEVCIHRMEEFYNANTKGNTDFKERLVDVKSENHPNVTYYIFKMIILHNLYGVDLMKEAVEIAKLRLFLKLVAEVDPSKNKPNYGLEPLPDIDFNIRSGNTLVGFATEQHLEEVVRNTEGDLIYKEKLNELKTSCDFVAAEYKHFHELQTKTSLNSEEHKKCKKNLVERLKELNENLNRYLADTYGLGAQTQWKSAKEKEKAYLQWKESHQPFHWFAEFYEIVRKGGFDVVIGNPPYVEYSKVKNNYTVKGYETISCGNLYALIMERVISNIQLYGKLSMIIPLASFSTNRMIKLQNIYLNKSNNFWLSNFESTTNPSTLFIGVKIQLSIIIIDKIKNNMNLKNINTTAYNRCYSIEREYLFEKIYYSPAVIINNYITRKNNNIEKNILCKINEKQPIELLIGGKFTLYFRSMGNFFYKLAFKKEPKYYKNNILVSSSTVDSIKINTEENRNIIISVINSSLFYFYWILFSDCYHLSKKDITSFHFEMSSNKTLTHKLLLLTDEYLSSIEKEAVWQIENKKDGTIKKYRRYFPQKNKYILNEIDKVLAQHYGFTEEELDFIINYDIKYRMGSELGGEDE